MVLVSNLGHQPQLLATCIRGKFCFAFSPIHGRMVRIFSANQSWLNTFLTPYFPIIIPVHKVHMRIITNKGFSDT